jgi:hypothetical protein
MDRQLSLIEPRQDWRLPEETKQAARRGLAQARAALAAGRARAERSAGEHERTAA